MPWLAAAGFKPAVYTNFTTLANRRMILEGCVLLEATAIHPIVKYAKLHELQVQIK